MLLILSIKLDLQHLVENKKCRLFSPHVAFFGIII